MWRVLRRSMVWWMTCIVTRVVDLQMRVDPVTIISVRQGGMHFPKRSLMSWVIVIPKEGRVPFFWYATDILEFFFFFFWKVSVTLKGHRHRPLGTFLRDTAQVSLKFMAFYILLMSVMYVWLFGKDFRICKDKHFQSKSYNTIVMTKPYWRNTLFTDGGLVHGSIVRPPVVQASTIAQWSVCAASVLMNRSPWRTRCVRSSPARLALNRVITVNHVLTHQLTGSQESGIR